MISISVETDIREAMRMLNLLEGEANQAASTAINNLARTAKEVAAVRIAERASLPIAKVRKRIRIFRSSRNSLYAAVQGNTYSPNLANYGASQGTYGTGASVPPGRSVFVGHAFIMPRGKRPVMIRKKAGGRRVARKPLESIRVEVLQRTWVGAAVNRAMVEVIRKRWPIEFERALRGQIGKLRGFGALAGIGSVYSARGAEVIE